jgi:hypothetical protein
MKPESVHRHIAAPALRIAAIFALLLAVSVESGPARARTSVAGVGGLWCGSGLIHEFSLRLAQHSQDVSGTLVRRDRARELTGRLEGNQLRTQTTKVGALVLEVEGDALRIVDGEGQLALARGMSFNRARGDSCT